MKSLYAKHYNRNLIIKHQKNYKSYATDITLLAYEKPMFLHKFSYADAEHN